MCFEFCHSPTVVRWRIEIFGFDINFWDSWGHWCSVHNHCSIFVFWVFCISFLTIYKICRHVFKEPHLKGGKYFLKRNPHTNKQTADVQ
jgi:hypothetical protein